MYYKSPLSMQDYIQLGLKVFILMLVRLHQTQYLHSLIEANLFVNRGAITDLFRLLSILQHLLLVGRAIGLASQTREKPYE